MPRLSLPREAPRALVLRSMPSLEYVHSLVAPSASYAESGASVRLDPNYYTDQVHAGFFVQKTWAMEVMVKPAGVESTDNIILLCDEAWRSTRYNTQIGFLISVGRNNSLLFKWTDANNSQAWSISGGTTGTWESGKWIHLAMSYIYNAADPTLSRFKFYQNGYLMIDVAGWFGSNLNNPARNPFQSFKKTGAIDVCGGYNHKFKYFRMFNYDPWPDGGFEIPDPYRIFEGSGQWMPGINDPQPYPTGLNSILSLNFQTPMTVNNIVDASALAHPLQYSAMNRAQVRFEP